MYVARKCYPNVHWALHNCEINALFYVNMHLQSVYTVYTDCMLDI